MSSTPPAAVNSVQPDFDAVKANDAGADALQLEAAAEDQQQNQTQTQLKWPGWPGDNVFRLIVPVAKVGSIIGRKGELIKKICDETRARIRILEGPIGSPDRVVLISGKEEPEAILSPAMDAVIRVYKRVSGLSDGEGDSTTAVIAGAAFSSIRLLVASSQAITVIGRQGSVIRSIQESTGSGVRVLGEEDAPSYATSDERIIEIHGEAIKVLKALEAVIGNLRKFLVDHSVIPVFEKTYTATISQERGTETRVDKTQLPLASTPHIVIGSDYSLSLKRDPSIYEHESHLDPKIPQSALSLYGQDSALSGLRSTGLGRATAPVVTQMIQTMQVPLSYAEDIIGVHGSNIAYIRQNSGAILTIQESRGLPDEITIEIKGTTAQVQMAQQLIQVFISNRQEPTPRIDPGFSTYSQVPETSYSPSSFASHVGGGYGSSSLGGGYGSPGLGGGYGSYRF